MSLLITYIYSEILKESYCYRIAAQQLVLTSTSSTSQAGPSSSSDIAGDEDQGYFGSYSHFGIHQEMLQVDSNIFNA